MIIILSILVAIAVICAFHYLPKSSDSIDTEALLINKGKLEHELLEANKTIGYLRQDAVYEREALNQEKLRNQQVVSQRKSSETRMGAITENLVPLLQGLPYDPKNLHHLGQPIDFIHFDYETPSITLIEVKSGNAKESKRQKLIKNCIKKGMVYYEKLQINEEGIKITREKNE
jgi:predicted Holliday junction resolvase-like endonuclease